MDSYQVTDLSQQHVRVALERVCYARACYAELQSSPGYVADAADKLRLRLRVRKRRCQCKQN